METETEKTIVKLELRTSTANKLLKFSKLHPFLNVTIFVRENESDQEDDVDLKKVEFHTHRCGKAEANRRFFHFFLIYAEWNALK
jgi:hypothetical protein